MQWIEKHKRKIILLAAAVLLFTAVVTKDRSRALPTDSAVGFVVTPLQKAATNIAEFFSDRWQMVADRRDLLAENESLRQELTALEAENKELRLYEAENERLSGLLGMARQYGNYKTVGARVVGKDPGNWFDIFLIDKGEGDGLTGDMALFTTAGLIGKTVSVGATYAKCQSILDPTSSVSAMSLRTGDLGVVKGDYALMSQGLCRMEYIDVEAQIVVGDEIITSNLSSIYPPGISIGVVKEIVADSNGLTKYAIIEPLVDMKHLNTLLVVTGEGEITP